MLRLYQLETIYYLLRLKSLAMLLLVRVFVTYLAYIRIFQVFPFCHLHTEHFLNVTSNCSYTTDQYCSRANKALQSLIDSVKIRNDALTKHLANINVAVGTTRG